MFGGQRAILRLCAFLILPLIRCWRQYPAARDVTEPSSRAVESSRRSRCRGTSVGDLGRRLRVRTAAHAPHLPRADQPGAGNGPVLRRPEHPHRSLPGPR